MFASIEQIKAARALLKWNQKDLAKCAGLNDDQVHSFESGRTRSLDVLAAIQKAFLTQGMEFVDGGVVSKRVSSYTLDSYVELLDDISKSLKDGGEVLKHCVDDRRSTPEVIEKIKAMKAMGIKERLTISDENDFITGDKKDYRSIPKSYFATSEVIIIFSNKVAFFADGQALIIRNQTLSDVFRAQFEYWWKQGKPIA